MSLWPKVREELNTMVNRHFDTPEYHQLFGVKLTPARKVIWDMHYPHYIKSRRDCWGAAAVHAPLDVKRAIWEHEKDELIFDKRMGSAHLTDEQMAVAAAEASLLPGVRAALMAWMFLSTTRPWIEALTVTALGGAIGVGTGFGLAYIISALIGFPLLISVASAVLGVGVSSVVGIISGLWPAWRAAKLDPIEAVRAE